MDTSRPPTSAADDQQKTRMTNSHANQYAFQESAYHQKPPSFAHKQVNISLVDDGNTKKQQQKNKEKQQQAGSGEWRESIPIKLEHLFFNFKENSLKVYKASPPRIMQIIALIAALLLFCGILALILSSQRDDNLKKEANLPSDQSAIAERIIGESKLLNHKLKSSFFDPKNQTALNEKQKKFTKQSIDAKDAAVRKAFGSLIFSNDDNDEPDQEENNSDESFDGERSHSKNFNLFSSDNDRPDEANKEKQSNVEQSENPRVMLIERLMGLHFGMQPKFGLSESLVIRKTIDDTDAEANKPENEIDLLLNPRSNQNKLTKETNKDARSEDPTPFLLRYAAAAMLSRVLAAAQQQAYIQQVQQQQRFREMNENQIFNSPYKGYRGYRNFNVHESAESSPNYLQREPTMYGRPMQTPMHPRHSSRPPMFAQPPPMQTPIHPRHSSRGPLISNEEAETQQVHPIILMLNLPYKDQQQTATGGAQLMLMSPAQSSFAHQAIEPIFMPYASRQNPYYKQQPQPAQREQQIYSPFAHKPTFYQPQTQQQSQQNPSSHESGYYSHYTSHPHSYNSMIHQHQHQQPINSNYRPQPSRTYIQRVPNTIEVPIEIHHQVTPSIAPAIAQNAQAQIIVQPQIETAQQPNDQSNDQDQSGENEHHMVVFYSDADNLNHSEENNNQAADNQSNQQPQQAVFVKESKQINQDLEKANQISKMLLLHFVNPNQPNSQQQPAMDEPASIKPFLVQPSEKPQMNSKLEEMTLKPVAKMQDKIKEMKPEEEPQSNDQMKRDELEKQDQSDSEVEPTSLAHFAQAIRHVIDQQQQSQQNQEQRPAIQPIIIEPSAQPIAAQQPAAIQQSQSTNANQPSAVNNYQPAQLPRKEQIVENSNKESQESRIPAPAFLLAPDNEEN